MPKNNIELVPGKLFFEDAEGNMKTLGEFQQYENKKEENDDAAYAIRYAVENTKECNGTTTFTITKEESIHLQKMLGIERISRKRFIKLLMGCRIQRNDANIFADIVKKNEYGYCPIMVQAVVEWIIKEIQNKEE